MNAPLPTPHAHAAAPSGLLRFITAGSVDDGKSTLIGRLLHDAKGLLADQITAIQAASRKRGHTAVDLSLLTDGLLAEREQGITIDVAYRYFATPARKFIIGDSPGHVQYTRNMVTAASTADLAILLVDARNGLQPQTRRHAWLARWVGIPRILLAVNKMDLVGYAQARFDEIRQQFHQFAAQLGFAEIREIPLSALQGDMVVERNDALGWYTGPTLMEYLETVPARHDDRQQPLRFPIQRVVRIAGGNAQPGAPYTDYRGYQGTLASGHLRVGDTLTAWPTQLTAKVTEILTPDGPIPEARADMAITLRLDTQLDLSRGDLLAAPDAPPQLTQDIPAELCWFHTEPLQPNRIYLIKQGTQTVRAKIATLENRLDVDTLQRTPAPDTLTMNDIARVRLRAQKPLAIDPYQNNRITGAFILIDETTNHTVAAGTIPH